MYKHILVPTDGSALSLKAARTAVTLASKLGASMSTVYVIPPFSPPPTSEGWISARELYSEKNYMATMRKQAAAFTRKVAKVADAKRVKCKPVEATGDQPWRSIIETARRTKCDLVVMSSHGRRGLAGVLLGSETHKVLTHSKIPVLVCR
jgi:nucleotide-binding universal stress UspA family protein